MFFVRPKPKNEASLKLAHSLLLALVPLSLGPGPWSIVLGLGSWSLVLVLGPIWPLAPIGLCPYCPWSSLLALVPRGPFLLALVPIVLLWILPMGTRNVVWNIMYFW